MGAVATGLAPATTGAATVVVGATLVAVVTGAAATLVVTGAAATVVVTGAATVVTGAFGPGILC